MLKGDTIPGAISIGFGGLFLIGSIGMDFNSTTADGVPGPGFFPVIVSTVLIILGIMLLVKGIKANGSVKYFVMDEDAKENLKPFLLTIAAIIVFLAAIKLIPFVLASLAFLIFLNWVYKRSWKFNVIFSVVFIGFVYIIFTVLLKVQFAI